MALRFFRIVRSKLNKSQRPQQIQRATSQGADEKRYPNNHRHVSRSKHSSVGLTIRMTSNGRKARERSLPKVWPSDMRNVTQRNWRRPASIRKTPVPDSCHRRARVCMCVVRFGGRRLSSAWADAFTEIEAPATWAMAIESSEKGWSRSIRRKTSGQWQQKTYLIVPFSRPLERRTIHISARSFSSDSGVVVLWHRARSKFRVHFLRLSFRIASARQLRRARNARRGFDAR